MIPDITNEKWKDLVLGKIDHQFKPFSVGMILSRIQREIRINKDENNLNRYISELYAFFSKYEKILDDDIKEIFG